MLQQVIILIVFIGASVYLARLVVRSFNAKNACESGCGKCGAIDLQKIEKEIKAKEL